METENISKNFNSFIKRLAAANLIFIAILTALSFFFLAAYNSPLLKDASELDVIKVFFSNIRFSFSALAYVNLPIILMLFLFPLLNAGKISPFSVSVFKSYYNLSFLLIFLMQFTYQALYIISSREIRIDNVLSKSLQFLSSLKGDSSVLLLASSLAMSLTAALFFISFTKLILPSENYAIENRKKSALTLLLALVLCVVFAKGKISGVLSFEDSLVTENEALNEFAANAGFHKAAFDIKNLNLDELQTYADNLQTAKKLPALLEKDILKGVSGLGADLGQISENMGKNINNNTYKALENIDPDALKKLITEDVKE